MKKILFALIVVIFLIPHGMSLAHDNGIKITVGSCAITSVEIKLFPPEGRKDLEPIVVKASKGCRCLFQINGREFVPVAIMPDSFCSTNPTDRVKKDKK